MAGFSVGSWSFGVVATNTIPSIARHNYPLPEADGTLLWVQQRAVDIRINYVYQILGTTREWETFEAYFRRRSHRSLDDTVRTGRVVLCGQISRDVRNLSRCPGPNGLRRTDSCNKAQFALDLDRWISRRQAVDFAVLRIWVLKVASAGRVVYLETLRKRRPTAS